MLTPREKRPTLLRLVHTHQSSRRRPSPRQLHRSLSMHLRDHRTSQSRRQQDLQLYHRPSHRISGPDLRFEHRLCSLASLLRQATASRSLVSRPLGDSAQHHRFLLHVDIYRYQLLPALQWHDAKGDELVSFGFVQSSCKCEADE